MHWKIIIITGLICASAVGAAYGIWVLPKEREVPPADSQLEIEAHTTPNRESTEQQVPRTALQIDGDTNTEITTISGSIDAWVTAQQKIAQAKIAEMRKQFETQEVLESEKPNIPSSGSTLSAKQKDEMRTAINALFIDYNELHIATEGFVDVLVLTATSTPEAAHASLLSPYISAYDRAAKAFEIHTRTAPTQIFKEFTSLAQHMRQATQSLKSIQTDASAGKYTQQPTITFGESSVEIVRTFVDIAKKLRELGVPIGQSDPAYTLLLISGVL